ncbi:MAG: hypothetical protein JWR80_7546 [Bradyrhizobium sp.]|nr:hypothetical protein [Bradyrhizobium sp.]
MFWQSATKRCLRRRPGYFGRSQKLTSGLNVNAPAAPVARSVTLTAVCQKHERRNDAPAGSGASRWLEGRGMKIAIMTFIGCCLAAVVALAVPAASRGETISGCRVVDGDTLNCAGERVRLLGIDAPELPGHCRQGRDCAPGDPFGSTASLESAVGPEMTIERVGQDRYGRTLAMVRGRAGPRAWRHSPRSSRAAPQQRLPGRQSVCSRRRMN